MKTRLAVIVAAGSLLFAANAQQPAAAALVDVVAWLRYLNEELSKLRLETAELRLEIEQAKTAELEGDLAVALAERGRLDLEVTTHSQEILSIETRMAEPGLPAEEHQQLLARKTDLQGELSERLRSAQSAAARENGARGRIDQQQRKLQQALAQHRALARDAGQSRN